MKASYRSLVGILILQAVPSMAMVSPQDLAEMARVRAQIEERALKQQQALEEEQAQALSKIKEAYEEHGIDIDNANTQEREVLIRIGLVFLGKTRIPVHGKQEFRKLLNNYEGFHPGLFKKYSGLRDALEEFIENQ